VIDILEEEGENIENKEKYEKIIVTSVGSLLWIATYPVVNEPLWMATHPVVMKQTSRCAGRRAWKKGVSRQRPWIAVDYCYSYYVHRGA
jgi:hypothetical protein